MRLIDADALRKQFEDRSLEDFTNLHFIDAIDNAPTVIVDNYAMGYQDGVRQVLKEVAEGKHRPQGEWYHSYEKGWECSQCHEAVKNMPTEMRKANYNFCPNCGADMRKRSDE